jgi:hypothetical protein
VGVHRRREEDTERERRKIIREEKKLRGEKSEGKKGKLSKLKL